MVMAIFFRAGAFAFPALLALAWLSAPSTARASSLNQAAAFYHQGRFDSALTRLEALKANGNIRHRDSLSLFQYLGMSSARLGREPEAAGYFGALLGLDSLFQFPRNEDPAILKAFNRAQGERSARAIPPPPLSAGPVPAASPAAKSDSAAAASMAVHAPIDSAVSAANVSGATVSNGTAKPASSDAPATRPPASAASKATMSLSYPDAPFPVPAGGEGPKPPPRIGLVMGAMPFGVGWFANHKVKHGLALGLLQAGGLALSIYASGMQTHMQSDPFRTQDAGEKADQQKWQWVQRVSLSTAIGAYLFSLIASAGD